MRKLIENFPNQIKEASVALKNLDSTKHDEYAKGFTTTGILVLGMGGSGIGGAFVASILRKTSNVPIVTNADYGIPGWVCSTTLVVACSNSGNTEETLAAASEAIKRGAKIACIASGGKLEKLAEKEGLPLVKVPGGNPPRSQFATSLLSLSWTLSRFGVFPEKLYQELADTASSTKENAYSVEERAAAISELIEGKMIHIYSDTNMECVAKRWRQQLNENSKLLVNSHVFPELNHNELVGWASGSDQDIVVIIRTPEDSERTQVRMDLSAEIFQEMGADVIFVDPDGEDQMQRLVDLVFLGDFISLLLAEKSGVDPVEIENIDRLKNKLSEL
jgi:glucose/mannose-6-phosphate isomerase